MRTAMATLSAGLVLLLTVNATDAAAQQRPHPRVLNFSQVPVVIDRPGHYVLNRNWRIQTTLEVPLLRVRAADVYIDLKGYELLSNGPGIFIEGDSVTVRNGRLGGGDYGLLTSNGRRTIVEDIQAVAGTDGIRLEGADSVARNITAQNTFVALNGPNSLLDSSAIRCRQTCAWVGEQSRVTNSQIRSSQWVSVHLNGAGNVLANNTITAAFIGGVPALNVRGDDNVVLNNVFLTRDTSAPAAMVVRGTRNVLRDNIAAPIPYRWDSGIVFEGGGNFYGNNQMASDQPFVLEAADQTDWGGNFGY
jgi:hypothetical protein